MPPMDETILIRDAVPGDFDSWLVLWDGYNAFYERVGATALPAEITRTTWARFFDPGEPMHALVAELDGELVGFVQYIFHRSTISIAPVCYLRDLFTAPSARGRGIATALIERVYGEARREGAPKVYWMTGETNRTAQRLYDKIAERSDFRIYQKTF